MESFSVRNGYQSLETPIIIRDDAPTELRNFIFGVAQKGNDHCNIGSTALNLLPVACDVLLTVRQNTYDDTITKAENEALAKDEIKQLLLDCEWYQVYDVAEAFYKYLQKYDSIGMGLSAQYAANLNRYFYQKGIGYKMENGKILIRLAEVDEKIVQNTIISLENKNFKTSASELREAYNDLSRKPFPELTGAVQHARAAVECVARKISGSDKTLGDLVSTYPQLFPGAISKVTHGIHGYTSNTGAHLQEGKTPTFKEAELMVSLSAAISSFLID